MSRLKTSGMIMIMYLRDAGVHAALRSTFASSATKIGKRSAFSHRQRFVGIADSSLTAGARNQYRSGYSPTSSIEEEFELEPVSP